MACATFVLSARMTPMPWVPSSSLMMMGGPAHPLDRRKNAVGAPHDDGLRHADPVAAQDLAGPELVARRDDGLRGREAEHAHLLELTHDRRTVRGDGRPDARNDRVARTELPVLVEEGRSAPLEVEGEVQRAEDPGLVTPLLAGLPDPARAVEVGASGQDDDLHRANAPGATGPGRQGTPARTGSPPRVSIPGGRRPAAGKAAGSRPRGGPTCTVFATPCGEIRTEFGPVPPMELEARTSGLI